MIHIDPTRRLFLKGLGAAAAAAVIPFTAAEVHAVGASSVSAVKAALSGDFSRAGQLAQSSGDPVAVKLVELLYLRDHGRDAGYGRVMAFLEAAPNWPLNDTMRRRAEQALYEDRDHRLTLNHFAERKPITAEGFVALARARYAGGDNDAGKTALRGAWLNAEIDKDIESTIIREFKGELTESDYRSRLWRLIYAQEADAAARFAKEMGKKYARVAQAAISLLRTEGSAEKKYQALSSSERSIPALRYALARHYRKTEKFSKARAVLIDAPPTASEMGDATAWWVERRIIARRSIGPNQKDLWNTAYRIASKHDLGNSPDASEAEFLCGWLALRFLKDPQRAMKHFANLRDMAKNGTQQALAHYWLGRTMLDLGNTSSARSSFREAAQHSTMYYGQLAREHIGLGNVPEEIASADTTSSARAKVDRDEVIRAFRIMAQAGTKRHLALFLRSISLRFETRAEMNAAASVVHQLGGTSLAVKLAKAASSNGVEIDSYSYPIRGLPDWKQIGKPVEKSLVFALARQESEFDPEAGSKVGAQGLMQLMPGTAKIIARQYGLSYAPSKLTSDPAYNVKLGAAHLADLINDFDGSYVLTLVAYNAGPRRATEWVQLNGDLRSPDIDPIDWVEAIPFQETRQYVQKVLQNLHVYRSRLSPKSVQPMTADLRRGSSTDLVVASTSAPPERQCSGNSIAALIRGCN